MTTTPHRTTGARWAPALRPLGDARLARLTRGGSDAAFAALYGRYSAPLFGYCRSLLHDEDDARDALQSTMLKALQALRRALPSGPVRPWLFRIAHNESVTLLRQRARRPGVIPEGTVAAGTDAHRHAAAREDLGRLLVALDGLTAHQRSAIVLRELGGLSYDDLARALDTSPVAARQAVFAARRRLAAGADLGLLLPAVPLSASALLAAVGGGGAAAGIGAGVGVGSGAAGGGLLSGLAGGSAGKAVAGALATASIGVGSVELVAHPPAGGGAEQRAQAEGDDGAAASGSGSGGATAGGGTAGEDAATTGTGVTVGGEGATTGGVRVTAGGDGVTTGGDGVTTGRVRVTMGGDGVTVRGDWVTVADGGAATGRRMTVAGGRPATRGRGDALRDAFRGGPAAPVGHRDAATGRGTAIRGDGVPLAGHGAADRGDDAATAGRGFATPGDDAAMAGSSAMPVGGTSTARRDGASGPGQGASTGGDGDGLATADAAETGVATPDGGAPGD